MYIYIYITLKYIRQTAERQEGRQYLYTVEYHSKLLTKINFSAILKNTLTFTDKNGEIY